MRKHLLTLLAGWTLLGCASQPVAPAFVGAARDTARDEAVLTLLLADLAAQGGNYGEAAAKYTAAAEQAADAGLARRAVQAALHGQDVPAAIAAATVWQRIEPASVDAAQLLTGLELQRGNTRRRPPATCASCWP